MKIICPYCYQEIDVPHGGWAYRYTQVLFHLDRCVPDRPIEERRSTAARLVPNDVPL